MVIKHIGRSFIHKKTLAKPSNCLPTKSSDNEVDFQKNFSRHTANMHFRKETIFNNCYTANSNEIKPHLNKAPVAFQAQEGLRKQNIQTRNICMHIPTIEKYNAILLSENSYATMK